MVRLWDNRTVIFYPSASLSQQKIACWTAGDKLPSYNPLRIVPGAWERLEIQHHSPLHPFILRYSFSSVALSLSLSDS